MIAMNVSKLEDKEKLMSGFHSRLSICNFNFFVFFSSNSITLTNLRHSGKNVKKRIVKDF